LARELNGRLSLRGATNYIYEQISMVGGNVQRLREQDWDGRVSKITWTDTDGSTREIDRSPFDSTNSQDTLTFFPGGT
jgi:hypothetical protein